MEEKTVKKRTVKKTVPKTKRHEGAQVVERKEVRAQMGIMDMVREAMALGSGLDVINRLIELQKEREAIDAKIEFNESMVRFQQMVPEIKRTKMGWYNTKDGSRIEYYYAPLSEVLKQVKGPLCDNGISFRHDIGDGKDENGNKTITVTCVLEKGVHSVNVSMSGYPDKTGEKDSLQQDGSTLSYLKRYTMEAALGVATTDDIDGRTQAQEDITESTVEGAKTVEELLEIFHSLPASKRSDKGIIKKFETRKKEIENKS